MVRHLRGSWTAIHWTAVPRGPINWGEGKGEMGEGKEEEGEREREGWNEMEGGGEREGERGGWNEREGGGGGERGRGRGKDWMRKRERGEDGQEGGREDSPLPLKLSVGNEPFRRSV